MRRIEVAERRTRLALRHHLAPAAQSADVVAVADDLIGLHATDPASVYLAARARMPNAEVGLIEHALYEQRSLVKMLGMRRTMFVVPVDVVPVVHAACSLEIAARERRRLVGHLAEGGVADAGTWLRDVEEATVQTLAEAGQATGAELAERVQGLRKELTYAPDRKWGGIQRVTSRVLFLLAADGRIVRGRPRGSWISSQHRWAPMGSWLPAGVATLPAETARAELVRRWLRTFGPGTPADIKWWTGWTAGEVKAALAQVETAEVQLDAATGLVLADDDVAPQAPEPWTALLPALDPTVMGWPERSWFVGDHSPALFDRSGNAGPTVWFDGRVVGGWAQRRDGEIVFRLLEDIGTEARLAVETAAEQLGTWIGDVRVTPRFRTPLERELGA